MGISSRAPPGQISRNQAQQNSMRPPSTQPPVSRATSVVPSIGPSRGRSVVVSPTPSSSSLSSSRQRSPTGQTAGLKRKERDFDGEGGEETNIHVVVRCRGRNEREVRENSGVVVATEGAKGKTVELSMGPSALSNKTYRFDKVFSPAADQAMIYEDVVAPILDEMLQGYNCTVFAYGQTGTGKTYTMSGDMSDTVGLLSDAAGIIPRTLHSLFRKLETDETESSVKCSFVELYNEELRDLLSAEENAKLKIFEDGQKKGHSATIVQGLEESHIKSAGQGIKLLQDGSQKRQVAATKCNDLSSRSHTVFTVTVYIKRTTDTGEDFVSAGKLNLVDLAGSENIQRSGAENKRAAEAGLINKSLLTLGRVINALVDRSSHIPYRESKLTRLLQDSLGGRTKTCIIATVSPAKSNLEETISTLDYAFKAKNIRNKPQVNQMISKKTLLKEFTAEIEKLKGELIVTRQRNGVYLTNDAYEEMTVESESRRILSEEQKAKIETMEANLRNKVQELFSLTNNFSILKKDYEAAKQTLDDTSEVLQKTEIVLADTKQNLADETLLRKSHQATEEELSAKGGQLISTLERTVSDVNGLHAKLRRKSDIQSLNRTNWQNSQDQVSSVTTLVEGRLEEFQSGYQQLLGDLANRIQSYVHDELAEIEARTTAVQETASRFQQSESQVSEQSSTARDEMNEVLEEIKVLREDVKNKVGEGLQGLSVAAGRISAEVIKELEGFHTQLHNSYSSLGRDFKNLFEDLLRHLNLQKVEAEELREQLTRATTTAIEADERFSQKLQQFLDEERQHSALDQQNLLAQITAMVKANGAKQEERLTQQAADMLALQASARSDLQTAAQRYGAGMDAWGAREAALADEAARAREALKGKLQRDWTAATERNAAIRTSTRAVHAETVRIVDAQMLDVAAQMRALDDFVTRARAHNENHHAAHGRTLGGLVATVAEARDAEEKRLETSRARVELFDSEVSDGTAALHAAVPPLTSLLSEPLSTLRDMIHSAPLTEYRPTGETPQKTTYAYPRTLPRTAPHPHLLSRTPHSHTATLTSSLTDLPSPPSGTHPTPAPLSPSKAAVYTDSPPITQQGTVAAPNSAPSSRPTTSDGGLREVPVNVNAGASAKGEKAGDEREKLSVSVGPGAGMGPPPLKRVATESRLPRGAGGKGGAARAEGRENVPVGVADGGGRRRVLRSSVHG